MASVRLINSIKYSKLLLKTYQFIGKWLIRTLKPFLKTDPNLIVFVTSGGKLMNDSPRYIYDYMINDSRFKGYKFVWAFRNPDKFDVPKGKKIQLDSIKYYYYLLKARVWVTNVSMTRGLSFTGIHTFVLNTWHGTPIKMIGADTVGKSKAFTTASKRGKSPQVVKNYIILAQGDYDVTIWQKAFMKAKENIKCIGLPRNDELVANNNKASISRIKSELGLPPNKKVIMYAPTFRDYERKDGKYLVLTPPIDLNKWEKELGDKYVLLFRAHPSVVEVMNIARNESFAKNVSAYPNVNELMLVSDMMISDYSSIFFDYSILGRPMLCFAYDYEEYTRERGVYFDIREALDSIGLDNEDRLLAAIKDMDFDKRIKTAIAFRDKNVQYYGNATREAVNIIYNKMNEE